jgi:hypothetical protein
MAGRVIRQRIGAADGVRTRDLELGKLALYQLSYRRILLRNTTEGSQTLSDLQSVQNRDLLGVEIDQ